MSSRRRRRVRRVRPRIGITRPSATYQVTDITPSQVERSEREEISQGTVILLDETETLQMNSQVEESEDARAVSSFQAVEQSPRLLTDQRRHNEVALAAHQETVHRALGIGQHQPDGPRFFRRARRRNYPVVNLVEEVVEVEDIPVVEEEDLGTNVSSPSHPPLSTLPTDVLNQTIDLTDSPPRGTTTSVTSTVTSTSSCESDELKCPVCLDTFPGIRMRGDRLVVTICGHVFCRRCLTTSISSRSRCPTCRRWLASQDFHPIYL